MSQKVSQRKRKKLDTLQSREYGDGITAYLYHNDDKDSDNVSEITQNEHDIPSFVSVPKKNSAFDKLFKALFTKKASSEQFVEQRNTRPRDKPELSSFSNSTKHLQKVHAANVEKVTLKSSNFNLTDGESRYQYLITCMHLFSELTNQRDSCRLQLIIQDIFVEDCLFQNAALKEPVVGRCNVIEAIKSIMRVSEDLQIEVERYVDDEVNGLMVLTMDYIMTGNYLPWYTY